MDTAHEVALRAWERVNGKGADPRYSVDHHGVWPSRLGREAVVRKRGGPPDTHQVEIARRYIRLFCRPQYGVVVGTCSYEYKHLVERWTGNPEPPPKGYAARTLPRNEWGVAYDRPTRLGELEHEYIGNGAFVEAAVREGYSFEPSSPGSMNAFFDMRDTSFVAPSSEGATPFVLFLYSLRNEDGYLGMLAHDIWSDLQFPKGRVCGPDDLRAVMTDGWDMEFVAAAERAAALWGLRQSGSI